MNNYHFDEQGFFVGVTPARIDPIKSLKLKKNCYLLPRNATHIPAPNEQLESGFSYRFDGTAWLVDVNSLQGEATEAV